MENEVKQTEVNQAAVLKELSDIKSSLAVNTNETANIKGSVGEIKVDIREIKNDFVNRREFNDALGSLRQELSPIKKVVYGLIGVILLAVIGAIIQTVLVH